jgi:ZIP family zinc transporter
VEDDRVGDQAMSASAAFLWGGLASSSLFIGQALAQPLASARKAVGLLMGFGAGTLISAVGYQLVPEASFEHGLGVGISFGLGAVTYYVADRVVDRGGGANRQTLDAPEDPGSPWAMFIGALLDGLPESFVLGITLALGGTIDIAFLTAVFVSNIPQGVAGTVSLRAAGTTSRRVLWVWTLLTGASALMASAGFALADNVRHGGLYAEAFAGGAVLTMLADSMMPEAFRHGGRSVGLVTVLGYLVAAALAVGQ